MAKHETYAVGTVVHHVRASVYGAPAQDRWGMIAAEPGDYPLVLWSDGSQSRASTTALSGPPRVAPLS